MSAPTRVIARRDLLTAGAAGAALLGLAGCGDARSRGGSGSLPPLDPPSEADDRAWSHVRDHFLLEPGVAYLNNASLGMPPRQVVEAVARGYRAISEEPLRGKNELQAAIADAVVPRMAAMFGARAEEMTLTRNASEALHLQSVGVRLEAGDEVVITTQEHPAGRRPWLLRQDREGVRVREVFVPSPLPPPEDVVGLFEDAVTPRTRAIAFCHVTRGGHLYPVRALCGMARARGLVSLVDGAQAVGQMRIDLEDLGCDAYAASLHKWVLGPAGTGFLYVRESARERIRTAFAHDATPASPGFAPPGTPDFPVRAALVAALDFGDALGADRIEERCRHLSDHLERRLAELAQVKPLSGERDRKAPGITIFEVAGLDAVEAVSAVASRVSAHIDEHQRDGHNAIRISTHVYNTIPEIDRVVSALTA